MAVEKEAFWAKLRIWTGYKNISEGLGSLWDLVVGKSQK